MPTAVEDERFDNLVPVPVNDSLGSAPEFPEVLAAVKSLKCGKAPGPDGIQAELIKSLSLENLRSLHEVICRVWTGVSPMPTEWLDSYLVPVPKKGDLSRCGKWRGILLTSVPGKIFSKIINGRLVEHFGIELGFVKKIPLYVLFVDLMKAYDSVSRVGLWQLLAQKGVPARMVNLIRTFYESKTARVASEGLLSDVFLLGTGLGQGCSLAPLLFNVFLSAVMEDWECRRPDKVPLRYRIDGILRRHMDEGSLEKYSCYDTLMLHELGYADDAAFVTDTYAKLVALVKDLQAHYTGWGLTMSVEKTEVLATRGGEIAPIAVTPVEGFDMVQTCSEFCYLGSTVTGQQGCVWDIVVRIDKARKAFWRLARHVWDVKQITLRVKLQVYRACVLSVLLYGAESWTTTYACRRRLEKFHMMRLRKISNVTRWEQEQHHVNNDALRAWLGVPTIRQMITQARLRWVGHMARMENHRLPKQMLFAFFPGDVGVPTAPGRRPGKWLAFDIVNDLEQSGVKVIGWMMEARKHGGSNWRQIVFRSAPWFIPLQPIFGQESPHRDYAACRPKPQRPKKARYGDLVISARRELSDYGGNSGFLKPEQKVGGRKNLLCVLQEALRDHCGEGWRELPAVDVPGVLCELPEWDSWLNLSLDVGLFCMGVDFVQRMGTEQEPDTWREGAGSGGSGLVRKRLTFKQPRPECYKHPNPQHQTPTSGVRVTTRRKPVYHAEGAFECNICGRKYTTKRGLAGHVELTHKEGTFREAGFQCGLCPRWFDRLSAIKCHYTRSLCKFYCAVMSLLRSGLSRASHYALAYCGKSSDR